MVICMILVQLNQNEQLKESKNQDNLAIAMKSDDRKKIETLKQNEFQSLEELSVTPLEDLLAISGKGETANTL